MPATRTPAAETVALHGAGGFGKTTMALGVCHDEEVFTACDGGILWATLGEQPSVVPELEKLYAALTGDRPGFKNQDDAMFELGKKLDGKRCLIVVDDAWNLQDVKPFLHGGAQCSRLITTRRSSEVAVHVANAANRIDIGELEADEATRVLAKGLPPHPTTARACGFSPNVLAMFRSRSTSRTARCSSRSRSTRVWTMPCTGR